MKINLKAMLLLAGAFLIVSGPCAWAHTDITAEAARELIDSTDDLIVIDVREPSEYSGAGGHIPGALNYPLNSGVLQARYEELPIDGPILVVCGSGSRSNRAAKFLDSMGFSTVYDMQGGMSAWIWETETSVDSDGKYGGGTGEPNDPYQIATAEDLILLGETPEDYDKHFILTADIDLDPNLHGRKVFDKAVIGPDTNDVVSGFQGTPFTGVFDGTGHVVSHLTVQGKEYLGLFGQLGEWGAVAGPEVRDLGVVDVSITGSGDYVGGLVGQNFYGRVTQCYSTGLVSGGSFLGGLVGDNSQGNIVVSYSTGTVRGDNSIGGLVGGNSGAMALCSSSGEVSAHGKFGGGLIGDNSGAVTQCYSDAEVSADTYVGGLVGSNEGAVTQCYSTGAVEGTSGVGGLVGGNGFMAGHWGDVTDCYSTGAVKSSDYAGGLVGGGIGSVTRCYSTGVVSGSYVGGLIGGPPSRLSVTACFWDTETSGQTTSPGGTGKTTTEMQMSSTFLDAGWDFVDETVNGTEDIWSICEGTNYPRFVWQIPIGDFVCPDGVTIDDFLFFLEHWLDDNCDSSNDYCEGTDLDRSGKVDVEDLEIFFENWPAE